MANQPTHQPIIDAPDPQKLRNPNWMYKFLHDLWARTGGQKSDVTDLKGLEASVNELNTLVGIQENVQKQLNEKEDIANLGTMAYQDASGVAISGGTIIGVSISGSVITIPVATSGENAPIGGILHRDMTAVGNVGSGEDTLITYTMPANVIPVNFQFIEILAFGTFAATGAQKTVRLKFGASTVFTMGPASINGGSWEIWGKVISTGSSSQKVISRGICTTTLLQASTEYYSLSEDATSSIVIQCTGEATNDNDVVQEGLIIKWFSN
jgi:hypothetical protein